MSRFRKAWLALTGRLEPEVREVIREVERLVIGEASVVKLYRATRRVNYGNCNQSYPAWSGNAYLSCEQAHSECPEADVAAFDAIKVGDRYFIAYQVQKVQPKPKRAKGRK